MVDIREENSQAEQPQRSPVLCTEHARVGDAPDVCATIPGCVGFTVLDSAREDDVTSIDFVYREPREEELDSGVVFRTYTPEDSAGVVHMENMSEHTGTQYRMHPDDLKQAANDGDIHDSVSFVDCVTFCSAAEDCAGVLYPPVVSTAPSAQYGECHLLNLDQISRLVPVGADGEDADADADTDTQTGASYDLWRLRGAKYDALETQARNAARSRSARSGKSMFARWANKVSNRDADGDGLDDTTVMIMGIILVIATAALIAIFLVRLGGACLPTQMFCTNSMGSKGSGSNSRSGSRSVSRSTPNE